MKTFITLFSAMVVPLAVFSAQAIAVPKMVAFADMTLAIEDEVKPIIAHKISLLIGDSAAYQLYIDRCNTYFPIIEQIFAKENLPTDFKFLGLQESGLSANASNSPDRLGFWQLVDSSAKAMGMRVDEQVDERKHIVYASMGAAQYLKRNYYFLRNWLFTLLSYDLGLTITTSVVDNELLAAKNITIDKNTPGYLLYFLAYKLAFEQHLYEEINGIRIIVYPHAAGKTLDEIADLTGLPRLALITHNSWLATDTVPADKNYSFLLPVANKEVNALASRLGIPAPVALVPKISVAVKNDHAEVPTAVVNSVVQGQIPYPILTNRQEKTIGNQTIMFVTANGLPAIIATESQNLIAVTNAINITYSKFITYNDMGVDSDLEAGRVYYLKKKNTKGPIHFHSATPAETMWQVAQKYAIRLDKLCKLNRMSVFETLKAGRVIWLSQKRPANTPVEYKPVSTPEEPETTIPDTGFVREETWDSLDLNARFHRVKEGETLFAIAQLYQINILDLQVWNDLEQALDVPAGTILQVKPPKAINADDQIEGQENADNADEIILIDAEGNVTADEQVIIDNSTKKPTRPPVKKKEYPKEKTTQKKSITHKVVLGETLWQIAKKYGVSAGKIVEWNNLSHTQLTPGTELIIYPAKPLPHTQDDDSPQVPPSTTTRKNGRARVHILQKGETLYGLSKKYQLSIKELMNWNGITDPASLKNGQKLYIENPSVSNVAKPPAGYHIVHLGDQVQTIAYTYNITANDLYKWNALAPDIALVTGQKLIISETVYNKLKKTPSETSTADEQPIYHTVGVGENLYRISLKYQTKVANIQVWNNIQGGSIKKGQQLIVGYRNDTTEESGNFHIVKAKETLYSIAKKYNTTVANIRRLNNKSTSDTITIGEKLRIK